MNKAFTIFGGSGDLTYRKLLPALYKLFLQDKEETIWDIIAVGRRSFTQDEYKSIARDWVKRFAKEVFTQERFDQFSKQIHYVQVDIANLEEYQTLASFYQSKQYQEHIFYFAVAPKMFLPVTEGLKQIACTNCSVIVEKPFGETLALAKQLNAVMEQVFTKDLIYHIDHYLGKEMIQSIQSIRFHNAIFQGIWNKDYIENIQISAFETVGVGTRGGYYDDSGALKDMVQNHLFQILSLVAMEPSEDGDIQKQQIEVLRKLRPMDQENISKQLVLGQYENYRMEDKVQPDSATETYAALTVFIDHPRWMDVPFYIRTGKKLWKRETEVVVQFKQTDPDHPRNVLIIKIQPNEGVYLQFNTKKPGETNENEVVSMDFCQSCQDIYRLNTPEAYERLLKAAMSKDRTLFPKWELIETSWNYIDRMMEQVHEVNLPLVSYLSGSFGPEESDAMLAQYHHTWFNSERKENEYELL